MRPAPCSQVSLPSDLSRAQGTEAVRRDPPVTELKISIKHFPSENTKLAEMEFYLLEDLDFHLTVFHPYRSLAVLCGRTRADTGKFLPEDSLLEGEREEDVKTGRGTGAGALEVDKEIFEHAW